MKKIIIGLLSLIVITGCNSYLNHYYEYYYEGTYCSKNRAYQLLKTDSLFLNPEFVKIQCIFVKDGTFNAFRIFQLDENGETMAGLGSDFISFRQNGEYIYFDDSEILFREVDGTYVRETIGSGTIGRSGNKYYITFDAGRTYLWLDRGKKNPLAEYYK